MLDNGCLHCLALERVLTLSPAAKIWSPWTSIPWSRGSCDSRAYWISLHSDKQLQNSTQNSNISQVINKQEYMLCVLHTDTR